jgi:hypothetical protein
MPVLVFYVPRVSLFCSPTSTAAQVGSRFPIRSTSVFFILFSKTNAWLCITRGAVAQLLVYELTHMEYHALLKTSLMSFNCNLRPFCPIDIYFVIMKR